ncbi:hypothetical protein ACFP67_14075 [Mammaliicoccus sciuri]|nr:hypothetical protein [Mammaliicoccus sciuri]
MNRIKRWKDNIILNFKEHTLITLLLIAMYAAFIRTVIDLIG